MLIYKQRYKPRTTREFTKSDLTVYDSAGNTALNALTVYGKSEVVNNEIVSAGEGWSVVRLADLTWSWWNQHPNILYADVSDKQLGLCGIMCSAYPYRQDIGFTFSYESLYPDKTIYCSNTSAVYIKNTDYSTKEEFVASLGDATLAYQLADPTQGNAIAIKTDNGSGINGTMAVFETGTPLRGIPNIDVRDVMVWNGSAGEVTKKCGKVRLADLTWNRISGTNIFYADITAKYQTAILTSKYTNIGVKTASQMRDADDKSIAIGAGSDARIFIKDTDYTTVTEFVASLGDAELIYELETPTTTPLTSTENDSIAGLRTYTPQTHAQNNAQTEMTLDYTIRVPTI